MAKKVKLTLSGFAGVYDTQYTFHEGDGLDTVIRAYVDEDEEAMDEIDDCGGLDSYIIDLPVCNPDGLAGAGLSLNIINDLTLNEVTAVVDGETVFSKNWSDDGEWLENIVEEKIASAMTREEDFRQPVFDLISEGKHEEIVAIRKMEGDHIDIYLEYEFEIEDEFDFNKFQFMKSGLYFLILVILFDDLKMIYQIFFHPAGCSVPLDYLFPIINMDWSWQTIQAYSIPIP